MRRVLNVEQAVQLFIELKELNEIKNSQKRPIITATFSFCGKRSKNVVNTLERYKWVGLLCSQKLSFGFVGPTETQVSDVQPFFCNYGQKISNS